MRGQGGRRGGGFILGAFEWGDLGQKGKGADTHCIVVIVGGLNVSLSGITVFPSSRCAIVSSNYALLCDFGAVNSGGLYRIGAMLPHTNGSFL